MIQQIQYVRAGSAWKHFEEALSWVDRHVTKLLLGAVVPRYRRRLARALGRGVRSYRVTIFGTVIVAKRSA